MPRKSPTNRRYSIELKKQAVTDYLSGKGSQRAICAKYGIASHTQLQNWVTMYNSNRELTQRSATESDVYEVKGRSTTLRERAEAVAYYYKSGKDLGLTVEKFGVSYQQITSWVKKYERNGIAGLIDRRGRTPHEPDAEQLSELERLIREACGTE